MVAPMSERFVAAFELLVATQNLGLVTFEKGQRKGRRRAAVPCRVYR
jgi:hypothetical protein